MQNFFQFVWAAFKRKPYRPILVALLLVLGLHIGDLASLIRHSSLVWLADWVVSWWTRWALVLLAGALLTFLLYRQSEAMRRAEAAKSMSDAVDAAVPGSAQWAMDRAKALFQILAEMRDAPGPTTAASHPLAKMAGALAECSAKLDDSRPVEVSIIVPVYNEIAYTLTCLHSLLEHATRHRYEVLIGDDCSIDETPKIVESIGGIVHIVRHAKNLGFLRNCNETAKIARGNYLVFLNNDAFVLEGWLDKLIAPFEQIAKVGLVGSKLLNADGRLQEAGGIVWNDGSARKYGRNENPDQSEFNYLKDVDYCSGCSIVVRREIWTDIGGFDERFSPAYYEDVDLAFSIRARGYRTLYNPDSIMIHHEGVSQGTDLSSGIKAYQIRNQKKFAEKWSAVLKADHYANGQEVLRARDRSRGKPTILIADHYVPKFDRDTGSRTMFAYLKLFVDWGFHVVFWPEDLRFDPVYVRAAQRLGVEVIYGGQYLGKFPQWLNERGSGLSYALLVRPYIANNYVEHLRRFPNIKLLYFGVDVHFLRLRMQQRYDASQALRRETDESEALERKIWSKVDVIYYPADFEVTFVAQECPDRLSRLFPLYLFDPQTIEDAHKRANAHAVGNQPILIFCAGFSHPPNVDAALWLSREIWPRVVERFPNAVLYLVGSSPTPEVRALKGEKVHVTDYVPDAILELLYEIAHVAIVPMRYGGGVKGKVLEAMRFGVPVATTSVGIQGIPNSSNIASVSDDAQGLANAVIRLLTDPAAAKAQTVAAVRFLEAHYSQTRAEELLALDIPEFRQAPSKTSRATA